MLGRPIIRVSAWLVKMALLGIAIVLLIAVAGGIIYLERTADLKVWHEPLLDAEFKAGAGITTFRDYLILEDRLFRQLDSRILEPLDPEERSPINRFTRGSRSDPGIWPRNWNRSYVLDVAKPRAVVLLIHGMSDSPYSLRNLAETLHGKGAAVIGLRLPGHGTIPAGLLDPTWRDMAAAVSLAVAEARRMAGDAVPVYLVGYSIGGALSVHFALEALKAGAEPVDGLVLVSPAIGLTPLARLSSIQARMGHILGLRALAWNSTTLEYDPFKYGSFPINAAEQSYLVTEEIKSEIAQFQSDGRLAGMPPILAFQSILDATVSSRAVVESLLQKLPTGPYELVLFDVNRRIAAIDLMASDPGPEVESFLAAGELGFTLSLVTNADPTRHQVMVRSRAPADLEPREMPLALEWPDGIYSLSHVALPFPASDPLYGDGSGSASPGIQLGNLALRGERGEIVVSPSDMLRLRWNPFYPYLEQRVLDFVGLGAKDEPR